MILGKAERMKIYLVAIDLDGTLLNSDKGITATTAAILRAARQEHGVRIVLSSARPPRTVLPFHKLLDLDTPLICYNGALVFDPCTNGVLMHRPVSKPLAQGIVTLARKISPNMTVSVEILDRWYTDHLDEGFFMGTGRDAQPDELASIDRCIKSAVTRLVLAGPVEHIAAVRQEILTRYAHQVILSDLGGKVLQIVHATTSKAQALRVVAAELGVTRQQTMAIGDQLNDVAMLQWAGVGVAMGNAPPEVKAVADVVTDHHDSDGAAKAIHDIIIKGLEKPRWRK